ncbi:MAG: GNAT family N-acetyltransferase [Chloroflexota bacterium]|nr:GNAT family N-acetyltransferase [Chloroflexota bacterium]
MPPEAGTDSAIERGLVVAHVVVRACRSDDLPGLEWFDMYRHHREIFRDAFARHVRGDNVMLVADLNDFPVGQAWVDLTKRRAEGVGYIWAVRVLPCLHNLGIGTLLMRGAERVLRARKIGVAEVGVEKDNADARRLYERLGYAFCGELSEEYGYTTPDGVRGRHLVDQWILRKRLDPHDGEVEG